MSPGPRRSQHIGLGEGDDDQVRHLEERSRANERGTGTFTNARTLFCAGILNIRVGVFLRPAAGRSATFVRRRFVTTRVRTPTIDELRQLPFSRY